MFAIGHQKALVGQAAIQLALDLGTSSHRPIRRPRPPLPAVQRPPQRVR
jgi:hypothetical protein